MNELMNGQIKTIQSMEVAKMIGKEHKEVMWMIDGNEKRNIVGIKPTIEISAELHLSDYFIKSTYKDSMNRTKECYKCTKMGCELLANKLTGEKGILFTAKYVKKFNDMEEALGNTTLMIQQQIIDRKDKQIKRLEALIGLRTQHKFEYGKLIKRHLGIKKADKNYEAIKLMFFYELGVDKWEDITYDRQNVILLNSICETYKPSEQLTLF